MSSPGRSYSKAIEVKYSQIPRSISPADISGTKSHSGCGFAFAIDVRTPQELSRIQQVLYKSQERTALIALAVDIDEEEELAKEQAKKLDEIEAAVENAKAEVEACQKKYEEFLEANRPNEEKLTMLENELLTFQSKFFDDRVTRTQKDKMTIQLSNLEIAKVTVLVIEGGIAVLKCEDALKKKKEELAQIALAYEESKENLEQTELHFQDLKVKLEIATEAWKERWGVNSLESDDDSLTAINAIINKDGLKAASDEKHLSQVVPTKINDEVAALKEQIEFMAELNKKKNEELEALKAAKVEDSKAGEIATLKVAKIEESKAEEIATLKAMILAADEFNKKQADEIEALKSANIKNAGNGHSATTSRRGSASSQISAASQARIAALEQEKQAIEKEKQAAEKEARVLKSRIDIMGPLWQIGYFARGSKIEKIKPRGQGRIDHDLMRRGEDGFHGCASLADACMYLSPGVKNQSQGEYLTVYGITAQMAWEHRNFKTLHDMLTWNAEMNSRFRNVKKSVAFTEAYDKLFKRISPDFKLNDIHVQADEELRTAYETLKKEHTATKIASERARRGQNGLATVSHHAIEFHQVFRTLHFGDLNCPKATAFEAEVKGEILKT